MLTKLTLTIDQSVVIKAKNYAKMKHRSVSKLVEDYLRTVSETENIKNPDPDLESPLTDSITGIFKEEYNGQSYKEILESALLDKFL